MSNLKRSSTLLLAALAVAAVGLGGCPEPADALPSGAAPAASAVPSRADAPSDAEAATAAEVRQPAIRPGRVDKAAFEQKVGADMKDAKKE